MSTTGQIHPEAESLIERAGGLVERHRVPPPEPPTGLHYGWWIVLSAMLSVFVSLGVGRFALAMLLPAMGEALTLSYVQMGWISTANFVGYLLGAIWVRRLLPRFGERRLIAMSLMGIVASMVGVALASGFVPILVFYAGTGLGSGIAFVCAVALVPHWFTSRWRGRANGFLSAGAGLAIILAGWTIPLINTEMGILGWRLGWGGLAAVCLPLALICLFAVRNRPEEKGLEPFGAYDTEQNKLSTSRSGTAITGAALRNLVMRLGVIYFLFGATYVVYGTFAVTTLVREHGMAEATAGQFWIWLGVFTIICGPVLGAISDRLGRRAGVTLALLLQAGAHTLIAYGNSDMAVYVSVALFGLSAFGVPLIVTAATADYMTAERAAGVIGTITVFFGLGQMIGPVLAGLMADFSGTFTAAYLAAASLVALAIAVTLTLPDPPE